MEISTNSAQGKAAKVQTCESKLSGSVTFQSARDLLVRFCLCLFSTLCSKKRIQPPCLSRICLSPRPLKINWVWVWVHKDKVSHMSRNWSICTRVSKASIEPDPNQLSVFQGHTTTNGRHLLTLINQDIWQTLAERILWRVVSHLFLVSPIRLKTKKILNTPEMQNSSASDSLQALVSCPEQDGSAKQIPAADVDAPKAKRSWGAKAYMQAAAAARHAQLSPQSSSSSSSSSSVLAVRTRFCPECMVEAPWILIRQQNCSWGIHSLDFRHAFGHLTSIPWSREHPGGRTGSKMLSMRGRDDSVCKSLSLACLHGCKLACKLERTCTSRICPGLAYNQAHLEFPSCSIPWTQVDAYVWKQGLARFHHDLVNCRHPCERNHSAMSAVAVIQRASLVCVLESSHAWWILGR